MPPSSDDAVAPRRRGVRILLVCPDALRAERLRLDLEERFLNGRVHTAFSFDDAREALLEQRFDLLAVDAVAMPLEGLRFLVDAEPLARGAVRVMLGPPDASREADAVPAAPGVHYLWMPSA